MLGKTVSASEPGIKYIVENMRDRTVFQLLTMVLTLQILSGKFNTQACAVIFYAIFSESRRHTFASASCS